MAEPVQYASVVRAELLEQITNNDCVEVYNILKTLPVNSPIWSDIRDERFGNHVLLCHLIHKTVPGATFLNTFGLLLTAGASLTVTSGKHGQCSPILCLLGQINETPPNPKMVIKPTKHAKKRNRHAEKHSSLTSGEGSAGTIKKQPKKISDQTIPCTPTRDLRTRFSLTMTTKPAYEHALDMAFFIAASRVPPLNWSKVQTRDGDFPLLAVAEFSPSRSDILHKLLTVGHCLSSTVNADDQVSSSSSSSSTSSSASSSTSSASSAASSSALAVVSPTVIALRHHQRIDVNQRHKTDGRTALSYACENDDVEAVRMLLEAKANPDLVTTLTRSKRGDKMWSQCTSLFGAATMGHVGVVQALLEDGRAWLEDAIDTPKESRKDLKRPIAGALTRRKEQVVKMLMRSGRVVIKPLDLVEMFCDCMIDFDKHAHQAAAGICKPRTLRQLQKLSLEPSSDGKDNDDDDDDEDDDNEEDYYEGDDDVDDEPLSDDDIEIIIGSVEAASVGDVVSSDGKDATSPAVSSLAVDLEDTLLKLEKKMWIIRRQVMDKAIAEQYTMPSVSYVPPRYRAKMSMIIESGMMTQIVAIRTWVLKRICHSGSCTHNAYNCMSNLHPCCFCKDQTINYCSAECAAKDWQWHKNECAPYRLVPPGVLKVAS